MSSYFNQSDKTIEATAFIALETLKVIKKDLDINGYNQHNLYAALIIAIQIKNLHSVLESLCKKLADIQGSIDCSNADSTKLWMVSEEATIAKAKELGIDIPVGCSYADLRYMIACKIKDANG